MAITAVKIFPSIGIARLGNSPEFFVGPELPHDRTPPAGGYRDSRCRIKRQGARFRIFGFDGSGNLVQEVTQADATIEWTVELANTKSAARRFDGLNPSASLRNAAVVDRATLAIDPGARTLSAPNQAAGFNTGRFLGTAVALGEMRTEADGRLLVLGGFGRSASVPPGKPIVHYANNDAWYDDVSDGPVTAKVTLNGTTTALVATPSWVICAPPDFAPPLESVTTLYDVLLQVAIDQGSLTAPATPSFTNDVHPILTRVLDTQRVSQIAALGHSTLPGAFPPAAAQAARQAVFARVRNPNNPTAAGAATMPLLWDDVNGTRQVITKTQYGTLQKWAAGSFTDDWTGVPTPPATTITPDGLTRAALEACVGGAFFPGIEASWFLRDTYTYSEPFRLQHTGRAPGDVTKQMAVPWQADFYKCTGYGGYAWWPAQRPDDVFPESGGGPVEWIRELVASHKDMVENWDKLGFVVNKGGSLVETERRKVCTNIFLVTDKSHFSEDEVAGLLTAGSPARFQESLYVIAEGFLPAELGVTSANPTPAQLAAIAPVVEIRRADTNLVPGMTATPQQLLLELPALPASQRQRFTFVYSIDFTNTNGFSIGGTPVETQPVTATATKSTFTSTGTLMLVHQPNPYMLDGSVSWLSTDVRVFTLTEGSDPFGVGFTLGSDGTAALAYLNKLVSDFNTHVAAGHPYEGISTDQNTGRLELSQQVGGKRVFNFAVARVRYRGNVLDATDVRVFFRLFTTAATGLDYSQGSTYRRSTWGPPISLLGLQGGELVTIPCYGKARVDSSSAALTTQTDPLNVRKLVHAGAQEVHGYFGCWLDFNQTAAQFPNHPVPADGPWTSGRKSVQELIRGLHQCLVAEVHFDPDPIPEGASPASNDNLAQRNLAIVESENPGSLATHTVQHTFEIEATSPAPEVVFETGADGEFGERVLVPAGPDELMIRWADLPRETRMTLYMPDVDAAEIMRLAGQRYEAMRLEVVDPHTIACLPADVTYVPIPEGRAKNVAALLTLELPPDIRRRESFHVVVRQLSGRPRSVLGAFQLSIPVADKEALLEPEIRHLSVLRWIGNAIPRDDQWHPVFVRYLDQIADRVSGFGGDPDSVAPSPAGTGRDEKEERCTWFGRLAAGLLALFLVVAALHPLPAYLAEVFVALVAVGAGAYWIRRCAPSACRIIAVAIGGLGLGAALVGVLWLLGAVGDRGAVVLALASVAVGLLVLAGWRTRCLRPTYG